MTTVTFTQVFELNYQAHDSRLVQWQKKRQKKRPSFLQAMTRTKPEKPSRSWLVTGVVVGGITAVVGWWWVAGQSVIPLAQQFITFAEANPYSLLVYSVGATLLPLAFFPATIIGIEGGFLFGLAGGILFTSITQTVSGMLAYGLGRQFKQHTTGERPPSPKLAPYIAPLQEKPFESVVIMRLLYMPHEIVSYACGWLDIGWRPFFFGTALGLIPSTIVLTSIGASIRNGILTGTSLLSPPTLLVSSGILVGSLLIANRWRKTEQTNQESDLAATL